MGNLFDWLDYVFDAFGGAWMRSWNRVGFSVNIVLVLVTILISRWLGWSLSFNDDLRPVGFLIGAFLCFFFGYLAWEFQARFPWMIVKKRNTLAGATIVIFNKEVADLTDIEIELYKRVWVSRSGGEVNASVSPDNRFFEVTEPTKVSYHDGTKEVLLASVQEEAAAFNFKTKELDAGHEYYDNAHHSVYDVTVLVKGKMKGRFIYPKKITGRLNYLMMPQEFSMHVRGKDEIIRKNYARMEWEDPDYDGYNFTNHTQFPQFRGKK